MKDFLAWLEGEAHLIFVMLFMAMSAAVVIGLIIVTTEALMRGIWIVPVLIWVALPAGIIAIAYAKDRKND